MPTTYADDTRTQGQKDMDAFYNGGGYEQTNPGAFDFFTDAFSTQNAAGGSYDVTDFAYGGSLSAQRNAQADLVARGEAGGNAIREAGNQDYNILGRSAAGVTAAGSDARTSALQSANVSGQYAADLGARADQLGAYGDQQAMSDWRSSSDALQNYKPGVDAQIAGRSLSGFNVGDVGNQQIDTYQALRSYADQGPGPSAAEAQLKSGLDANVANQIALARSGRGSGANAAAMRQAQFQAADMGQKTAAEMAALRANEAANWRGQQLQAMSGAGSLAASAEQARQGNTALSLQARQASAEYAAGLEGNRLAALQSAGNQYGQQYGAISGNQVATDQSRQAYLGQSLQAQQMAAQQASGGYDQYLGALTSGAGLQNTAAQNRQTAYQAGLGVQSAYDQAALGVGENEAARRAQLANTKMNADTQASLGNQQADAAQDASQQGMAAAAIGALAMSDRRQKTSIRRYCAMGGQ